MINITRRGLLVGVSAFGVAASMRPGIALAATERTNHALLVACTAYPNLSRSNDLVGPNHDAEYVRDYLTKSAPVVFKPENVSILADNLEGANAGPAHDEILARLAGIAEKAVRGDYVYLHFSGHGAYQPALVADSETTGFDQIFLPNDVAKWADDSGRVPNALIDDELGKAIAAIRDKGAFVWCVIDACHSGTATRAAAINDGLMVQRQVKPEDLGIPKERLEAAEKAALAAGGGTRSAGTEQPKPPMPFGKDTGSTGAEAIDQGKLVAFYAAQTVETTPEMPLPRGVEGAVSYGLFTFTIFSELAKNPNMTYRQLGQSVLQQYAAGGLQKPTPLFEGELDARVFGSEATARVLQWPLAVADGAITIPAGLLQGVTQGSRLAVVKSAAAEDNEAAGYVEVIAAQNLTSKVRPVAVGDKPALALDALPPNAFARLTDVAVDFELTVARPTVDGDLDSEAALVNEVLDAVTTAKDKRFNVKLVDAGKEADIRLAVMRENAIVGPTSAGGSDPAVWFLSASGDIETNGSELPPRIVVDPATREKLTAATAENLEKIFRATSLARVGSAMEASVPRVNVEFQIKRKETGEMQPLQVASVPVVNPDDQVHILARNDSNQNVDINILYIGSDYSIQRLVVERLVPQAVLKKGLFKFTDGSFGTERMIAVLTPAPAQSIIEDLKYLEQGGVPTATRSAGESGGGGGNLRQMLGEIGMGAPASRAAALLDESDDSGGGGAVMMFPVHNKPRA